MARPTLRVLLIEDSAEDAALVVEELSRAGYEVKARRVCSKPDLEEALRRERWDCAIGDFTMPSFSGTKALTVVREFDADLPFLFVSGTLGEDTAVAAMKAGAQDYIVKGNLKRLVPAIEREIREAGVRRSRAMAEARLAHLAYHDSLTGLPNRLLLHDRLSQAVADSRRTGQPVALLILDLDGFKAVNDSLGHPAGDRLLQRVAARFRKRIREVDTIARLGGDEFAFVLPRTNGTQALTAAQKLVEAVSLPFDDPAVRLTGSFGIAWCPEHGTEGETLLQKADIAMYVAKNAGLGVAMYAAERDARAHRKLDTVNELRYGIEHKRFFCQYQPIVGLATDTIVGVEALARWRHSRQGVLDPGEFIPLAEQTGLIEPLTMMLLDKALGEWSDVGGDLPALAFNLSGRHLRDPHLPERVISVLGRYGLNGGALTLELTENTIMADRQGAAACLARLRRTGVTLAIDDFGTGYSSLSYLRELPVDVLKIDRSFVSRANGRDEIIIESIVDLAHALGMRVVAEGVESQAVLDTLQQIGCDAVQGFFVARPASAPQVKRWLASRLGRR